MTSNNSYIKIMFLLLTAVISLCGCTKESRNFEQKLTQCEDSLINLNYVAFHRQFQQLRPLVKDSDQHYQLQILQAEYYFSKMQCDSFIISNRQVKSYLHNRYPLLFTHPDKVNNPIAQDLFTKWLIREGVYYQGIEGKLDSAQLFNIQAYKRIAKYNVSDNCRLNLLNNIADCYKASGEYDKSINYYTQAMQVADSINASDSYKIGLTMGIAAAYTWMEGFQRSQIWWDRAENMMDRMNKKDLFIYYNNRGNDYFLQDKYKQSMNCYLQLERLTRNDSNMVWEREFGRVNQAVLYVKTNQMNKARPLIQQAEEYFTKNNYLMVLFYINTIKLEYYTITRQFDKAQLIAEEPIDSIVHPDQKQLRMLAMDKYFLATKQWEKLAKEQSEREKLENNIHNNHVRMQFATTLLQYQQDKRLVQQRNEIQTQKARFRLGIFILIGCLCIIALILYILHLLRRQVRLLHNEMHSTTILMRMQNTRNRITPHFIFNALNHEMLAQIKGQKVNFNTLVTLIRRSIDVTDKFCTTLQSELEFIDYYVEIESNALGSDFRYNKDIASNIDTSLIELPSMIIQIFVENAIKHGLRAKPSIPGKFRDLLIRVCHHREGTLIEVIDNGVGMKPTTTSVKLSESTQTGTKVVRQTIALLNEENKEKMEFGIEDYTHENGDTGCRSYLYLPHHFSYSISINNTTSI